MAGPSLSGCKIAVTGATGFLGSHLTSRLYAAGADVHVVSRSHRCTEKGGPRWWQGDLADIAPVREIFEKVRPEVIFHLSGLATASPERELVLPTLHSLLVSTVNILMAASESGCGRVVLAASLTEPTEGHPEVTPGSPYAAAKWASGAYARMFRELYDVPVVMVRPFMTYGPGQDERKLIPYVIHSLLRGEAPKLSSGRQQIDWVYIDDVIDGFIASAMTQDIDGETIDLGSGLLVPIRDMVGVLVRLTNSEVEPLFGTLPDRPLERARIAKTPDAYRKLGWKATTSLEVGLEKTIAWYRERLVQSGTRSDVSETCDG
jgi:UDP-glucose 4-epimerase